MGFVILFVSCWILVLTRDVGSAEIVDDVVTSIFYKAPTMTDPRHLEIALTIDDDNYKPTDTLGHILQYGYEGEEHTVTTDDGYRVTIFRISGGPESPSRKDKPVSLIQHGIFASSDGWTLFGPDRDLAFLLADEGYDVWLGNVRGNYYGRSHTNLTTEDPKFWDYSHHEIGTEDLPSMIDYILGITGQTNLSYIGHSLGTTVSFVLLSEKPEYNDKFNVIISLAPFVRWAEGPNWLVSFLVDTAPISIRVLRLVGIYSLFPRELKHNFIRTFCKEDSLLKVLCVFVPESLFGIDTINFDYALLPYIGLYNPAGISIKTCLHIRQAMISGDAFQANGSVITNDCVMQPTGIVHCYTSARSGECVEWLLALNILFRPAEREFRHYDYDDRLQMYSQRGISNKKVYGTKTPPLYDLSKVTTPVAVIYAGNDALVTPLNAIAVAEQLPNLVTAEPVASDSFNHLDFMWGTNAKEALYDRVIELVSTHAN